MSFILEALKKSESERQRLVGPSLADVPVSVPRESKPWWAIAIGALLLINLIVLTLVLLRGGAPVDRSNAPPIGTSVEQPPTHAPVSPSTSASDELKIVSPARVLPQTRSTSGAPSPAVRSLADEATVVAPLEEDALDYPGPAAAARVPEGPAIVRQIDTPAASTAIAPVIQARSEQRELLPTFEELLASGLSLPEMHLDIHVHSPVPAERFVFVNMRKYVEGQTLAEGPTLEEITTDGVVLNHRGTRFLLPKQ